MIKIKTGLPGFDQITGGGLPRSSAIMLSGEAGTGKEMLTRQLVWNLLQNDAKILYFSVDQSAEELRYFMQNYGWNITPFEANGQLKIIDIFSRSLDRQYKNYQTLTDNKFDPNNITHTLSLHRLLYEIYDINDLSTESNKFLAQLNLHQNPSMLILDTITPLFSTTTKGALALITEMIKNIKGVEAILLILVHQKVHNDHLERALKPLTDASITIQLNEGTSLFLNILQYPGEHVKGPFPLDLTVNGVTIIPVAMPELI